MWNFTEAFWPNEEIANDEERPALADELERPREPAVLPVARLTMATLAV